MPNKEGPLLGAVCNLSYDTPMGDQSMVKDVTCNGTCNIVFAL